MFVRDEGVGETVIARVAGGAEVLQPVLAGVEFLKGGLGEGEEQAAGVWVGGVFFDDDGATGGECGGGVTAEGAVGERKVAGGEDGDRPDGDEVAGEVVIRADGLNGGLDGRAVGGGKEGVGGRAEGGEEAEGVEGSVELGFDLGFEEVGFVGGGLDDPVAVGFERFGDGGEAGGAAGKRFGGVEGGVEGAVCAGGRGCDERVCRGLGWGWRG